MMATARKPPSIDQLLFPEERALPGTVHPILDLCALIPEHGDCTDLPFPPPAEFAAAWFLYHLDLRPPLSLTDVETLVTKDLRLTLRRESIPGTRRALNCVTRSGSDLSGIICYEKSETSVAAKMTILHEVGEIILRPMIRDQNWEMSSERREQWSTVFASHVLAPEDRFRAQLDRLEWDPVALAIDFDMTLPAILTRMARSRDWRGKFFGIIYDAHCRRGAVEVSLNWKTAGNLADGLAESSCLREMARYVYEERENVLAISNPDGLPLTCDFRASPSERCPNRIVVVGFPQDVR